MTAVRVAAIAALIVVPPAIGLGAIWWYRTWPASDLASLHLR